MFTKITALAIPCLFLFACGVGTSEETVIKAELTVAEEPSSDGATTEETGDEPAAGATTEVESAEPAAEAEPSGPDLREPSTLNLTAPDTFNVKFETTKGDVIFAIHRAWSPLGVDRFYNLVKAGYFEDVAFFRAVPNFMVQFGLHSDPKVTQAWSSSGIQDEPVVEGNARGRLTFAKGGPNSRIAQMFISTVDNSRLDPMGFPAIGEVTSGMEVVDSLYTGYGEGAPRGRGPDQMRVMSEGNPYLEKDFPKLDYIKRATIVE